MLKETNAKTILILPDLCGHWALKWAIAIFLLWAIGNLLTGPLQHWFIFRPKKLPQDYTYQFTAPPEEIWLNAPEHGRLNALWFKRGGEISKKGVILFFHGNAGNLARWGHLHYYFARLGYDYFVYDYRGYGKSTGRRNEDLLYADALAAYDSIAKFYSSGQIVLYGRSLGSTFAAYVAAAREGKRLILETPFYSMKDLFYTYYPFLPRLFSFRYHFPSHAYLCKARMPVVIFQGTADCVVPFASAKRLQSCLGPGDVFYTVPGASHNNLLFYDIYNQVIAQLLK